MNTRYTRYILSADGTEEAEAEFYFNGCELFLDNGYFGGSWEESDYDSEDYEKIFAEVLALAEAEWAAGAEARAEEEAELWASLESWWPVLAN